MAIAKLNKNYKDEGESGYEQTPFDAAEANQICNTVDALIEELDVQATANYRIFGNFMFCWGNTTFTLSSSNIEDWVVFPKKFITCYGVFADLADPGPGKNNFTTDVGVQSWLSEKAKLRIKSTADYYQDREITVRFFAFGVV